MTLRSAIRFFIRGSGGHSLVEVVVATSLIVTVLLPLSGMAIYLFTVKQNEPHLVALAIGQQAMEETLHKRTYTSKTEQLDGGRWQMQKTVSHAGNQVTIVIRVYRRHRPKPLVELMTVRLFS